MTLKIGTRRSKLALWQANHVKSVLETAWPDLQCELVEFVTKGDKVLDKPLPEIGGKGLFTQELEAALLESRVDIAVHSLKDLPVENPAGITLGAVGKRADARDVMIGRCIEDLPQGAVVGTSSLRRASQLKTQRRDLKIESIRGNVPTRIRKCEEGQYDAIVLAAAGVLRLELVEKVAEYLSVETMLPAPGQAALGIQCRQDDVDTLRYLSAIHHAVTHSCVTAERAFLSALGGGCAVPVAAYAVYDAGTIKMTGCVSHPAGTSVVRVAGQGIDPFDLGQRLAEQALAKGAGKILESVKGS